ncbi:hypothetical protein GDO78_004300 [Eleutherodactylus coqui]|uniref:Uncharacterized protein n=1 Tax=Eleutherodactylus coqui TaxID=57060 RepID=A0A8J6K053_ELECQ|nr:hypothetical protein GDO78_004300 [Eleutherodactylus coqui]
MQKVGAVRNFGGNCCIHYFLGHDRDATDVQRINMINKALFRFVLPQHNRIKSDGPSTSTGLPHPPHTPSRGYMTSRVHVSCLHSRQPVDRTDIYTSANLSIHYKMCNVSDAGAHRTPPEYVDGSHEMGGARRSVSEKDCQQNGQKSRKHDRRSPKIHGIKSPPSEIIPGDGNANVSVCDNREIGDPLHKNLLKSS